MRKTDRSLIDSQAFAAIRAELAETARFLSMHGWTPATSSNFSALVPGREDAIAISRSGVDKARFDAADVMLVDRAGRALWPNGMKSSAETLIHTAIYDLFSVGAVLHTHSLNATALSLQARRTGHLVFGGLELLKGFSGIATHETRLEVPVFANDQEMPRFAAMLRAELPDRAPYGFLMAGHGLYTWGQTVGDARRHIEVFEFLFELAIRMGRYDGITYDS